MIRGYRPIVVTVADVPNFEGPLFMDKRGANLYVKKMIAGIEEMAGHGAKMGVERVTLREEKVFGTYDEWCRYSEETRWDK